MTITFILPFINLTGGTRVLLTYANWLHDQGHTVTVVYPTWPYAFQHTWQQRWGELRKHLSHNGTVPWFDLRCPLVRVPAIRTRFLPRADAVIATAWPTAHDVARLPACRGRKVQIVFHHETGTGPEPRIRSTYALPFYRIAFSRHVKDDIARRFNCHVDDVVPNGVDTALFFPDGEPAKESVLFLYHPDPRKGAVDGIAALSRLRARMPNLAVRVCGTVRPAELPSWMPFEFFPGDSTLRQLYSTSTTLVYPSRYEGFGLPPLEAMACGCPPVTTLVGAVPEYAVDGRNALIVAPGDVVGMAGRLAELLTDPSLRARLSAAGARTADAWSVPRVAPLFGDALRRAIASPADQALGSGYAERRLLPRGKRRP